MSKRKHVCSHCGAIFYTEEGLTAHLSILRQHFPSEDTPQGGPTDLDYALHQPAYMAKPRSRAAVTLKSPILWLAVAICIAAAGLAIALPHQVAHQIAISTTRQQPAYTALFFPGPETVPTHLRVAKRNAFRFKIYNHEGRATVYSYVVELADTRGVTRVKRGEIRVNDDSRAKVVVNVVPSRPSPKCVVTVSLRGRPETIHFNAVSR
jgi:hypothetical protein